MDARPQFDSDPRPDVDAHFDVVYAELRDLAAWYLRGERPDHTLQPTALVHEAYLRLSGSATDTLRGRAHTLALAALAMRRILVDHARRKSAVKRTDQGQPWLVIDQSLTLDAPGDLIDLDRALDRLAELDAREARIVELHFFGGLSTAEIAELVGLSDRMVRYELAHARAWLQREIT